MDFLGAIGKAATGLKDLQEKGNIWLDARKEALYDVVGIPDEFRKFRSQNYAAAQRDKMAKKKKKGKKVTAAEGRYRQGAGGGFGIIE